MAAGGVRQDGDGSKVALTRKSDELSEVREIDIWKGILSGRVARSEAPGLFGWGCAIRSPGIAGCHLCFGEVARPGGVPCRRRHDSPGSCCCWQEARASVLILGM